MTLITWTDDKLAKYGTSVRSVASYEQADQAMHAIRFGGAAVDHPVVRDVMQWVEQPLVAAFTRKPESRLHKTSRVVGVFAQSGVDFALFMPLVAATLLVRYRYGKTAAALYVMRHEDVVAGSVAYVGIILAGIAWLTTHVHIAAKLPKYSYRDLASTCHTPQTQPLLSRAETRAQAMSQLLGEVEHIF